MATPLDPAPPKRRYRRTDFTSRTRAAVGAGIGTLALAGAIVAAPGTALAQDGELATANAWVTDQIKAPGAWETTKGEGVTVAVIDSGISEHPFFEDKNVEPGFSVFDEEEDAWNDEEGHGTGVAAAVLLAAPEATILPVRSSIGGDLADEGLTGGAEGGQVESIRWAVDNGADVIVMSWGIVGGEPSAEFLEVMQYAVDKGVVLTAAGGNEPGGETGYPANIPGVVAVSGTDKSGNPWSRSTTGPEIVVAAPADEMMRPLVQDESLGWGDDQDQELYMTAEGGTSSAAGIVGGVLALILSADPDLDGNNAIQRLIQTAGDGSGSTRTDALGYGLIDADQAVNAEDIETVEENPLGYPMGEAGASGEGTDEEASGGSEGGSEGAGEAAPSASAAEKSGTGLSTIIIVAAAVVLVGAAIAVWLVLRGRSRKQAVESGQPGGFGGEHAPVQGGYPQTGPNPPQYGPPPGGGQNFSPPTTGGQQQYSPPMNRGESSPPWGPGGDPNQGR